MTGPSKKRLPDKLVCTGCDAVREKVVKKSEVFPEGASLKIFDSIDIIELLNKYDTTFFEVTEIFLSWEKNRRQIMIPKINSIINRKDRTIEIEKFRFFFRFNQKEIKHIKNILFQSIQNKIDLIIKKKGWDKLFVKDDYLKERSYLIKKQDCKRHITWLQRAEILYNEKIHYETTFYLDMGGYRKSERIR